jgi:hypothetical protein
VYNTIIFEEIQKNIPRNQLLVSYLMDTLAIAKEPAYRRIRGQVPFTFEEVAKISTNLGISIDNMLEHSENSQIVQFKMPVNTGRTPDEVITAMLSDELSRLKKLSAANDAEITMGVNRIFWQFFNFPVMVKLEYCRFLTAFNQIPIGTSFANIDVPQEIMEICQQIRYYTQKIHNITCIIQKDVILKTIDEINYVRQKHSISDKQLREIQSELFGFLEFFVSQNAGENSSNSDWKYYLCPTYIDTNSMSCSFGGNGFVQFWIYFESPFIIKNNSIMAQVQRRWLESRKKVSMLITHSNDLILAKFHEDMRKAITDLTKN